jgi:hypothetical protein
MENRIIEIIEIGEPKILIQREKSDVSELIDTVDLILEINSILAKT